MPSTITTSNGAAHTAVFCLQNGLNSIDDIYVGGGLSVKLRAAKRPPPPEKDELAFAYEPRVEAWMDADFGELEMTEPERDCLKQAIKNMAEQKKLPSTVWAAELIGKIGLK